ncbi:MAG: hypothetical protein M1816_006232 [Peltula sp. TS41687]|nr:MAG: hypothetical protein M1816_006232 [Peltula sp. TS41687]
MVPERQGSVEVQEGAPSSSSQSTLKDVIMKIKKSSHMDAHAIQGQVPKEEREKSAASTSKFAKLLSTGETERKKLLPPPDLGPGVIKHKRGIAASDRPKVRMNSLPQEYVLDAQQVFSVVTELPTSFSYHTSIDPRTLGLTSRRLALRTRTYGSCRGVLDQANEDATMQGGGLDAVPTRLPQNIASPPAPQPNQLQDQGSPIITRKAAVKIIERATDHRTSVDDTQSLKLKTGIEAQPESAFTEGQDNPIITRKAAVTIIERATDHRTTVDDTQSLKMKTGLEARLESAVTEEIVASQFDETGQRRNPVATSSGITRSHATMIDQADIEPQTEGLKMVKFGDIEFRCGWCQKHVAVDDVTVLLCNGCEQHMIFAMAYHWEMCNRVSFDFPVDPHSKPGFYNEYCAAIEDRYGMNNFWRHRQRAWNTYRHDKGDYFIFSDHRQGKKAGRPVKTILPTHALTWDAGTETKDVFNRLLNLAFYDHHLVRPLLLLYRLICWLLRTGHQWGDELEEEVNAQFWCEFAIDAASMTRDDDEPVAIWRDWFGDDGQSGVESIVKYHEDRSPILRYWRREYKPKEMKLTAWDRFWGKGFPDAIRPDPQRDGFSAGWEGYRYDGRLWQRVVPVVASD